MPTEPVNDLPDALIRAGRRAWNLFGEANRDHALDEATAVSLLARHLVALAAEGMTNEGALAAAGLRYLVSLIEKASAPPTSKDAGDARDRVGRSFGFGISNASAKFVREWRVRLLKNASV